MKQLLIGIVIAVVAGLIVLNIQYKFFEPSTKPNNKSSNIVTLKDNSNVMINKDNITIKNTPTTEIAPTNNTEIVNLHITARKIKDSYTKTVELDKLSELSCEKGEYLYAISIASDIPDSYTKIVSSIFRTFIR